MLQEYIYIVFYLVVCCCQSSLAVELTLSRGLLDAIRYVDSGGDICALGDNGGSIAIGAYQITRQHYQEAIVDGNRTLSDYGLEYEDLWGEGSIPYSEQVLTSYASLYATPARLGHVPTDEDIARIHHGGPSGWSDVSTLNYWRNVSKAMNSTFVSNNMSSQTGRCSPECEVRQCCDKDEQGIYRCFCLQAKVKHRQEYIKRPCEDCSRIAGIDIVFVLDCSLSIGAENFTKILNLSNAIVEDLVIGPTRTQVGAIVFSGGPHLEFGLSAYSSKEELASAISGLPYFGDDTDTADALYMLVDEGFAEARPPIEGVPQIAILVTDGQSNDAHRTAMAAQKLKRVKSITTYAVGVGDADIEELETIASVHNGEHLVRYISSYDPAELERLQEDLKDVVCTASINAPVEVKPIKRDIEKNTNVYVEFSVPEDGFTIEVEVEIGRVAVCGSNSLERPDCSYSLTYDWRLEVNQYSELYIGADGSPGGSEDTTPAPTTPNKNFTDDAITNATVFVTVEGLDTNNTFLLNTTYGDTTTPTTTATVTTEVTSTTAVPAVTGTTAVPAVTGTTVVPAVTGTTAVPAVTGTTAVPGVTGTTTVPAVTGTTAVPAVTGTTAVPTVSTTTTAPAVDTCIYIAAGTGGGLLLVSICALCICTVGVIYHFKTHNKSKQYSYKPLANPV